MSSRHVAKGHYTLSFIQYDYMHSCWKRKNKKT